jgi:Winged helix-turn-helix DNA-binding
MLVFCCMGTARQNGKRDTKGPSRTAEGDGGRPVVVATSSYVNIIEALLENGSMSRSELASSIGLSRSALTDP